MTIRAVSLVWIVAVWVVLWEALSFANVASGILVGVLLLWLFPVRAATGQRAHLRPLAALRLLGHFSIRLVEACVAVAWEVITPSNAGVKEGIVAVPLATASDAITALVANMFSLTPGTLVLEIDRDPTVLYVHVLHLHSAAEVRANLRALERMATRAFGSDELVAATEQRLAELEAAEAVSDPEDGARR